MEEEIEKELNILEIQYDHGMPWVEYERKKRELENKLDAIREGSSENGNNYLTKHEGGA